LNRVNRYRIAAAALAVGTGVTVLFLSTDLFPYHSANHDEGVYLQQAAMLLDGQLFLRPGSATLREAVHPWFFVESPRGLYPKYSPVPAAMFAIGKLFGGYRLALGAIAGANVALVYGVVGSAFDRRTGLIAAGILTMAPLFLLNSAVFLPYAPTTALNLVFALAYVRGTRREEDWYAVLAGAAIGLSFFARPYTAVLFAAPFVIHATWRSVRGVPTWTAPVKRYGVIAAIGTGFVGLTLAYNAYVTTSPLLFPYEAFAPHDGLGFGRRAILGHELIYTRELALRTNGIVLWTFASRWFTAGLLGTGVALLGFVVAAFGMWRSGLESTLELSRNQLRLLLVGIAVSVSVGNLLFWGNRNILGDLAVPNDGLISLFGPFYHFDLLLPITAFAAHGVVTSWETVRRYGPESTRLRHVLLAGLVLVALPTVTIAEVQTLGPPVDRNAAYTAKLDQAYAPFGPNGPSDALVFLPPTYGEWRNHPFQWLRNEPGFDGSTLYAIDRQPAADFAVLEAYPDREYFRYRYRGDWTPDPDDRVIPVLEQLKLYHGSAVFAQTSVAIPERVTRVFVAISNGDTVRRSDFEGEPPSTLEVNWTLDATNATINHPQLRPRGETNETAVSIDRATEIVLMITLTEPSGGTLTYREAVHVRPLNGRIEVLWPPASSTCLLTTDCGLEGTYVPDRPATRPGGITMNSSIVEVRP